MINVDFNEMLQADHLKICTSNDGHIGLLAIHDHFNNYAKTSPGKVDDYTAQVNVLELISLWFATLDYGLFCNMIAAIVLLQM